MRARADAPVTGARDVWVEVRINDVPQPDFVLLHVDMRGHLSARAQDLRAWHMKAAVDGASGDLVRIDDIPGVRARLEADDMLLRIEADPGSFAGQVLNVAHMPSPPDTGVPAVFLGYNLFAQRDPGFGNTYSALLEGGSSLGRFSFTSTWLYSRGEHPLDTAVLVDFPEYTARFTLGDSLTAPGTLGDSLRFTGLHWSTDYTTRPGLTPYALPVINGTAALPSSVELYINNSLVQRTNIDAGPFQLNNIPVPTGQGTVDIRVRDMLGQVQQYSLPYLVSPRLVTAGVTDFDFAAGAVREDYGLEDFVYGRAFVSGGVQHGLSDAATVEASAEVLDDQVTARGGVTMRVARNLTVELNPAVSHASAGRGNGGALETGFDALWPAVAFSVHYTDASPGYVELGSLQPGERLRTQWAMQASTQLGRSGSLLLLYARRSSYDQPTTGAATLNYNLSMRRYGALNAFVSRVVGGRASDVIAGITFTCYLGRGVTGTATETFDDRRPTTTVALGVPPPPDAGWGWELAHAGGETDTTGARLLARSGYGNGSAEIDGTRTGTLGLVSWQGGLVWAGGRPWPAQSLSGPAALLEVPDLGGIEVLHDGQPVGRTDPQGRLLVPALRPFEDNTLTLVPEDIPLTAMVDSEKLTVRPYSHGIVRAAMAVGASESRVFALLLAQGIFVPAGALVSVNGHTFPVGTEGRAQLPVAHAVADAIASWPGGRCKIRLPDLAAVRDAGDGPLTVDCKVL